MALAIPRADSSCGMRTAALPGALRLSSVGDARRESSVGLHGGQALARRRLLARAAPFLGAGLLPFATLPLPPAVVSPWSVVAAAFLTAAIVLTCIYAPWHRLPHFAQVVPPMAYFVVIALLRDAENGASGYTPLAMLPLFWLALYGTRTELAIGIAGVVAVFFAPLILIGPPDYPLSEWRRAVLWVAMAALVGFTVQRLVNQLRARAEESARRADALRRSEQESHAMLMTMASVAEAMQDVSREADGASARAAICAAAAAIGGSEVGAFFEPDGGGYLLLTASVGQGLPLGTRIELGREPSGAAVAFTSKRPFFVSEGGGHAAVSQRLLEDAGVLSVHFEPVVRDDESVGVLVLGWRERILQLPHAAASGLRMLAAEAAIAIDRADLLARLEVSARTDDLTGLPNRRAWEEQLPRELARAARESAAVCVAMLDLDRFKDFNDDRGHQAGDRLLKQSAAAWATQLRSTDMLARYGGEEFALVLPGCTIFDAQLLVERLRAAMPDEQTVSAGIAVWDGKETPELLVGRADRALYSAKKTGRDRLVVASEF
jgi:diguanylate cyclase (GGDEF)-like protein